MPARMIDGDALWRSDKLAQVEPPKFRAEYANMIPLALADGTFECNPRRVWADVYSYNRPDVTVATVEAILDEFERVGLLSRKSDEKAKVWGFWIGIEKRLPCESQRDRYKAGNSSIFNDVSTKRSTSGPNQEEVLLGLGLDRIGKDRIGANHGQGNFKYIAARFRAAFKVTPARNEKAASDYQQKCEQYGEDFVLEKFAEWAPENQWVREKKAKFGLTAFYKDLDIMAEGDAQQAATEQTKQQQEDSVKEIERHILAKAEADSRQRTETFNAEQAELDRAAAAQTAMLLGDQG